MSRAESSSLIPDRLFFRIRDVAEIVGVKPYVLRYWETEFPVLSPQKSKTGHRVYQRTDVETLLQIKKLLYTEKYSIEGARKRLRELRKKKQQEFSPTEQTFALATEIRNLLARDTDEIFLYA